MPRGFRRKGGSLHPSLVAMFGFEETESDKYPPRTRLNIENSDGTIQFAFDLSSPGERLTTRLVQELHRHNYHVYINRVGNEFWIDDLDQKVQDVIDWIKLNRILILNVAGNAEPRIEHLVQIFLESVFRRV